MVSNMMKRIWNEELSTGMTEDELIKVGIINAQGHYPLETPNRLIVTQDEECNESVQQAIVESFNFALVLADSGKDGAVEIVLAQDNLVWTDLKPFLDKARAALDKWETELHDKLTREQEPEDGDEELWIPNMMTNVEETIIEYTRRTTGEWEQGHFRKVEIERREGTVRTSVGIFDNSEWQE